MDSLIETIKEHLKQLICLIECTGDPDVTVEEKALMMDRMRTGLVAYLKLKEFVKDGELNG